MTQDLQFDMALSYCSEDGWAARDLYELVSHQGFSVYCYDYEADRAGGFLRNNLSDIYKDARLNVVFWSLDYSQKQRDTLVTNGASLLIKKINDLARGAFPETAKIPRNSVKG